MNQPDQTCPSSLTLSTWLDGELGQSESARIRDHVERCAACREQVRDWVHVVSASEPADRSRSSTSAACPDPETAVAYADRELSEANTNAMEDHLRHCAGCVAEVQRLIQLRSAMYIKLPPSAAPQRLLTAAVSATQGVTDGGWRARATRRFRSLLAELNRPLPALSAIAMTVVVLALGVRLIPGVHRADEAINRGPAAQPVAEVAVDRVAARARPGEDQLIVATLARGTRVKPLEQSGQWTRAELSDGRRVWIRAASLETVSRQDRGTE